MSDEVSAKPVDQTKLAVIRTYLAYERTLMAWVRTSTSLITFGVTLYKFFFFLKELNPDKYTEHVLGARLYGLIMIAIGIVSLVSATIRHQSDVNKLRDESSAIPFSQATIFSALIAALGFFSFAILLFRL